MLMLMPETWAAALESLPLAVALRGSVWTYPLINAGHILGVALLIGAILPLDLRLLGAWPSVPLAPLWRVLVCTAGIGFGLAMICGGLLFITRATRYVGSTIFTAKMVLVGIGLANILILHKIARSKSRPFHSTWPVRIHAVLSFFTWIAVMTLGRLVGYY